ncbi:MAG: LPXTG cell wall anchor domain-containing protein [Geothrix sp.]|nr:LPXTG cell wall anchor domain-containing protein [Geothrix sp.]
MTFKPLAGLALIALGAASLAWPEFSYTKDSHDAKLGPLEFTLKEKETVRVPVWAGLAAIAGGTLLLWRRKQG